MSSWQCFGGLDQNVNQVTIITGIYLTFSEKLFHRLREQIIEILIKICPSRNPEKTLGVN